MFEQSVRQYLGSNDSRQELALACGLGVGLGAASLLVSPIFVLIALVGVAGGILVLKRPEIAILAIIGISSTIIADDRVPVINIGPGRLYITDAILLALFGLFFLRWMIEREFKLLRSPLDAPIIIFVGVALLVTVNGFFQSGMGLMRYIGQAIPEVRVIIYYLTFFTVTNLVREERQLKLLLRGFFFLSTFVAAAMVAQYVLGQSVRILPGRVEALGTHGTLHNDVTRITDTNGESMVLVGFITETVILALCRFRPARLAEFLRWGLTGLAVVITFNRYFWIGSGLTMLILALLVRGQDRKRLVGWGALAVLVLVAIVLLAVAMPDTPMAKLVGAAFERLASLGSSDAYTSQASTLKWRSFEYRYAIPRIASRPFLGLGLGMRYRPLVFGIDWEGGFDGRRYVHNAHIWLLMKTGIVGYMGLLWFSLTFLYRGFKHWRQVPNRRLKGTLLGFTLTYIAVFLGSIVHPLFMEWYWAPIIGVMMGTNEIILRRAAAPVVSSPSARAGVGQV